MSRLVLLVGGGGIDFDILLQVFTDGSIQFQDCSLNNEFGQ